MNLMDSFLDTPRTEEGTHCELLKTARLPGRLLGEQAAILIGCRSHDIPILVKAGLLLPLGEPVQNSVKYFCTVEILGKIQDRKWLHLVTTVIQKHWKGKHLRPLRA